MGEKEKELIVRLVKGPVRLVDGAEDHMTSLHFPNP